MAEVLAITAVALAAPPSIHALTKIWVKIAGMLHLSSPAQYTYLLSRIRHLIDKSRAELEKGSGAMSPVAVKEYEDKLNKTIELYNRLVTSHSTANHKTRLDALKTAEKASARLLKDIKIYSQKCGDEKLTHAVKTCLAYDQNVRSPDGTIAAYRSNSDHPQNLQLPRDAAALQTAHNESGRAQAPQTLPLLSASESGIDALVNSPPRFYIPVELYWVPQMLSSPSNSFPVSPNSQIPPTGPEVLQTTAEDGPLVDLGTTEISEVIYQPEDDSS
ncbi:hypothetical protein DL96DRAFT_636944 [Flagelloscypha sp. PMI_526]|nr:hypothetical protein DL96DRAFT_636944 [Flagelloscypha sp. PMI_526]